LEEKLVAVDNSDRLVAPRYREGQQVFVGGKTVIYVGTGAILRQRRHLQDKPFQLISH
jgi:hypothetical protein